MKKHLLSILLLLIGFSNAFATHNRAGEITYKYIGTTANPYKYKIIVTTYTKFVTSSTSNTDKCELMVLFGDGDSASAPRVNGPAGDCSPLKNGVMIGIDTRLNVYETEHNYAGPGNYIISMEDPNRNSGICNIVSSVDVSFFLRTELVISPFLVQNNSPTLLNPPIDNACVGVCFEHNPGAYDIDGDSLHYSLSVCYANGLPLALWSYPPNMNASSINPLTGDLVWCVPTMICEYNVAIVIKEYRLLPGTSTRYYIGSVLRDMQIDVKPCINDAPIFTPVNDTCVIAGSNLNFNVFATDPQANLLTITATGGPLLSTETPPASFTSFPGIGAASGTFNWNPSCTQLQLLPYLITFKATDGDLSTPLVNFESMFIRVIAPAPTGLTAVPSGSSILLNWNYPFCDSTGSNPLKKFYIYRKNTCDPWTPGPCETGVPSYTGYTLIGTTNYTITNFIDNNGGAGLINGVDYSYIVVAYYVDGSQSIASDHVCAQLVRDVPIMTNVSVMTTNTSTGTIWTHWVKPIGNSANLDTIINPPPYEYRLMKATGFNPPATAYTLETTYTFGSYTAMTDTGFVSNGLNTEGTPYTFKVDFYSNGIYKGSTQTASSVFLSSTPADKQVNLTWQHFVPWNNYEYFIYRETSPGSTVFNLIDSTTALTYADTGLVNEVEYCYRILAVGEYSDTLLPKPLRNYSQINCETPVDIVPPCAPPFDVVTDCEATQNTITWVNPNTFCSDQDAVQINIYFSPNVTDPMQLVYSTTDMSLTSYTLPVYYFEGVVSIAGCYAVTAVDSALTPNESVIVNRICVDNCPEYELPNVFTPNDDGKNDFFTPLPDWRFVKDVDIKIFDRWGLEMFSTDDPNVLWDGKNKDTKQFCSDGTYFYVCTVNEIRIDGIKPRVLKGFVQIIKEGSNPAQ
ncbi:MAG: gliding motility-associated C-terminal domain-containing protein [Bacteroidetes bacterium]|nr:gliding motility-associated C-terminal domain-containing protein [Bacteroidota bacterium]